MKISDLYTVLSSFRPKEWSKCERYLEFYCPGNSKEVRLFKHLSSKRKRLPKAEQIKTELFFSDTKKNISTLLGRLAIKVERFLIHENIENKPMLQQSLIHDAYLKRELFSMSEIKFKEVFEGEVHYAKADPLASLLWHLVAHQEYFSYSGSNRTRGTQLLLKSMEALESYKFIIEGMYDIEKENLEVNQIKESKRIPSFQKLKEFETDCLFAIEDILPMLSTTVSNIPIQLDRYKQLNINTSSEFSEFSLLHVIQYCFRQVKLGNSKYLRDLCELYDYGLAHNIFLRNGYISENRFLNIMDAYCAANQLEKAKVKLEKHTRHLHPSLKKASKNLIQCQIQFAARKFQSVLDAENTISTKLEHQVRYRWLKLACLCELEESTRFNQFLKTFSNFVDGNKKKLSPISFLAVKNFIELTRKMARKKKNFDLVKELRTTEHLVFRSWLQKKAKGQSLPN